MKYRRAGLGWTLEEHQALANRWPETHYFGFAYGNWQPAKMTGGLFGNAQNRAWFQGYYGKPPDPRFNDPDFDLSVTEAGREPAYSRIRRKLAAIDPLLPDYRGPTRGNDAGPVIDFTDQSPAYTGVNTGTITFNTPGGPTTVTNGVVVSGPGATPPAAAAAGGNVGLWLGLGLGAVGLIFVLKG